MSREMAFNCQFCIHADTCYGEECNYRRKKTTPLPPPYVSKIRDNIHINKSGRLSWGVIAENKGDEDE